MTNTDIIVIGGGLCGVTFSHYAACQGKKIEMIERRDTLGGCLNTVFPDGSDYFVESGAHTIYNSYATILEMIENMQIRHNIVPQLKNGYLMWGKFKDKVQLYSIWGKFSWPAFILGCLKIPFNGKMHGRSVKEFYTTLFGKSFYDYIIHPTFSAIICQDCDDVAADLMLKRRAKNKEYVRSFTMTGGIHTLLRSISSVDGINTHLSTTATSIKYENGIYTVETDKGGSFTAKQLVVAATAHESAELIANLQPEVAKTLKELPINSSRAVSFTFPKEATKVRPFNYVIAKDADFTAIVSRDTVKDEKFRGGTIHFKPGTNPANDVAAIRKVYGFADNLEIPTYTTGYTLPQLSLKHYDWRKKLESQLDKIDNFYLLGNFFDGMSLEDCCLRAKGEALRATK